jgi:hypothetical protein
MNDHEIDYRDTEEFHRRGRENASLRVKLEAANTRIAELEKGVAWGKWEEFNGRVYKRQLACSCCKTVLIDITVSWSSLDSMWDIEVYSPLYGRVRKLLDTLEAAQSAAMKEAEKWREENENRS